MSLAVCFGGDVLERKLKTAGFVGLSRGDDLAAGKLIRGSAGFHWPADEGDVGFGGGLVGGQEDFSGDKSCFVVVYEWTPTPALSQGERGRGFLGGGLHLRRGGRLTLAGASVWCGWLFGRVSFFRFCLVGVALFSADVA